LNIQLKLTTTKKKKKISKLKLEKWSVIIVFVDNPIQTKCHSPCSQVLHPSTMPIFSVTQGSLTLAGLSAFLSQHHHQQQQQIFATTDHASPFFTITSPLFIPPSRTRRSTNNITAKFSVSANAKAENSSETAITTATDEVLEPSPDALRQARVCCFAIFILVSCLLHILKFPFFLMLLNDQN
jgi:hypothetical protein